MLADKIAADIKDAMRSKDEVRLLTLRSLRAALKDREIAERSAGVATLTEEQELAVLRKQVKQRKDSFEQYKANGREDLALREEQELAILADYLPQEMDDQALRAALSEVITQTGAQEPKDLGRVMGAAMKTLKGKVEGDRIRRMASELLGSQA